MEATVPRPQPPPLYAALLPALPCSFSCYLASHPCHLLASLSTNMSTLWVMVTREAVEGQSISLPNCREEPSLSSPEGRSFQMGWAL